MSKEKTEQLINGKDNFRNVLVNHIKIQDDKITNTWTCNRIIEEEPLTEIFNIRGRYVVMMHALIN